MAGTRRLVPRWTEQSISIMANIKLDSHTNLTQISVMLSYHGYEEHQQPVVAQNQAGVSTRRQEISR